MVEYYIGNRLVQDNEGVPVIDEDGQEICVLPEEFDYLGRPGADQMHGKPEDLDAGEQ